MSTTTIMRVNGNSIAVDKDGYICLTDMAKAKAGEAKAAVVINGWLKTKSAIEYLGLWERDNNPYFKVPEFRYFKESAGKKHFNPSTSGWIETTGATGIYIKAGKNGGTYAHKDIAYEFGTAISVEFRYLVFKEYQKLKEQDLNKNNPEWNTRRLLCKTAYVIQTDAVKNYKIPMKHIPPTLQHVAYAEEADLINLAVFGFTAKQWKQSNVNIAMSHNVRDFASTNELMVLSSLEGINAEMIKSGVSVADRLERLKRAAKEQMATYERLDITKSFRKTLSGEFKPFFSTPENKLGMFPIDDRLKQAS